MAGDIVIQRNLTALPNGERQGKRPLPYALLAVALFLAFALVQTANPKLFPDFFIYRLGAELALNGQSPYNLSAIRARVAEQYPDPDAGPDSFVNNCGYFLPPMAVLVYAPFAMLPWPAAKVAWAIASALAAFGITRIPSLFQKSPPGQGPIWNGLVPFLLVVNFLALAILQVGQSTLVVVGCVAFGQWCFERNRPALGTLLWSVAFIKPHVALPLVPLAWYLGGWKRAVGLVAVVVLLNVAGAIVIGSPMVLRDYVDFLAAGHKAVAFNLAERNPEITSWNRLLFVATGTLVEQTAPITLASYLIFFGLVLGRCALAGKLLSAAWAMAAAAVAAAWCPQVLAYEAYGLVLVVPWLRELFATRSPCRQVLGIVVALLLIVELLPYPAASAVGITFHRPLAVALLAVAILFRPVARRD
jgi:hypothetical protein